jgi:predicted MFS family arabinose efflux permease
MGQINSDILMAYTFSQIFLAALMGSLFEILGRKFTLLSFSFLQPVILSLVPYTAPNVYWLGAMKILMGFGFAAQKANPLLVDYIKKESRGSASALKTMGQIAGQTCSTLVFLKIASFYDNGSAFQVGALLLYCLTLPLLWMVKEPIDRFGTDEAPIIEKKSLFYPEVAVNPTPTNKTIFNVIVGDSSSKRLENKHRSSSAVVLEYEYDFKLNRSQTHQHALSELSHDPIESDRSHYIGWNQFRSWSKRDQLSYLITQVWRLLSRQPRYAVSLLGFAIANIANDLINVYFVLWLSSFVNSGLLENQDQAKTIFETVVMWSGITLVAALPLIGWASDRLPPFTVLVFACTIRGCLLMTMMWIDDPKQWVIYFLVPCVFVFTALQLVCIDIIFFLHQPKNLRGALAGTRVLFSNLMTVLFIYYAGFQFDNVDKSAPFYICGFCDLSYAIVVAVLLCAGAVTYS